MDSSVEISTAVATSPTAIAPTKLAMLHNYPMLPKGHVTTHDALVSHLTQLAESYRKEKDYYKIRTQYIAVSMALNEKKLLAPAFRDQPKISFKHEEQEDGTQLLIDQIVIDCHWLYCRNEIVEPKWPALKELFNPGLKFDAEAVSVKLGARNWSRGFRASEFLGLTDRQQHQLLVVSSPEIHMAYTRLQDGYTIKASKVDGTPRKRVKAPIVPIRRAIRSWAENVHQIRAHQSMYEALWVARELLGRKALPKQLAELAGLIIGRPPLDRTTVRDKYVLLDKMLSAALS